MGSSPVFGIFILHQLRYVGNLRVAASGKLLSGGYLLLKAIFILVLLMILPMAGFGLDDTKNIYNNPNIPIEVRVGEEFSIVLPSNPTTGYKWELATLLDDDVLELQDTEYTSKCPKDGRVGCGGMEEWNFFAVSDGETTILLKYIRPWEKNVKPAETRVFKVTVYP